MTSNTNPHITPHHISSRVTQKASETVRNRADATEQVIKSLRDFPAAKRVSGGWVQHRNLTLEDALARASMARSLGWEVTLRPTRTKNGTVKLPRDTYTFRTRPAATNVAIDATFIPVNRKNQAKPQLNRSRLAPRQVPDGWYVRPAASPESPRKCGWEMEHAGSTRYRAKTR